MKIVEMRVGKVFLPYYYSLRNWTGGLGILTWVPFSVPSAETQSCLHWPSKDNNKSEDRQARVFLERLLEAEVRLNPGATIGNFLLSLSVTYKSFDCWRRHHVCMGMSQAWIMQKAGHEDANYKILQLTRWSLNTTHTPRNNVNYYVERIWTPRWENLSPYPEVW